MEIPSTLCSNVYDFAFCPEPCYDRLVDLADPEDWGSREPHPQKLLVVFV